MSDELKSRLLNLTLLFADDLQFLLSLKLLSKNQISNFLTDRNRRKIIR